MATPRANWWDDDVTSNLSTKRVRPWDFCDDVQVLKKMLTEKEEEFDKVVTQKGEQLAVLQRKLVSVKSQPAASPAVPPLPMSDGQMPEPFFPVEPFRPNTNSPAFQKQVSRLRKTIQMQVVNQMAYKPSARHGSARLVPVDVFDLTVSVIEALVGEELLKKASSGPKQLMLEFSNEEVAEVFNHSFSKSLRYGASLELNKGLKVVFSKF